MSSDSSHIHPYSSKEFLEIAGNFVSQADSVKTNLVVITGTKEIGLVIYADSPPSNTTFTITGGTDKDLFTIDASTGILSFTTAMFYQSPLDFDRDGNYNVVITATETSGLTNTSDLQIKVSSDRIIPELTDFAMSYTVNEDGATVIKLTGYLTDNLSGVDATTAVYGSSYKEFRVVLKDANTGEPWQPTVFADSIVHNEDGSFEVLYTMPSGMPPSLYYVGWYEMKDNAGNVFNYSTNSAESSIASIELPNALYEDYDGDLTAPELTEFAMSYTINDDGATVIKLTGYLTDNLSGVDATNFKQFHVVLADANTGEPWQPTYRADSIVHNEDGSFEFLYTMPSGMPNALYYVYTYMVKDAAGNVFNYYTNSAESSIASIELPNALYDGSYGGLPDFGDLDKKAPEVSNLVAQTKLIDGKTVLEITGTVIDDNPILNLSFTFTCKENPVSQIKNAYNATFDANGNFTIQIVLDSSVVNGNYFLSSFTVTDDQGNSINNYGGTGFSLGVSADSPILGLKTYVDNAQYVEDKKAPEVSNLVAQTKLIDGKTVLEITGTVIDDNPILNLSFTFTCKENPVSQIQNNSNATFDANGNFTIQTVLDSSVVNGNYFLSSFTVTDDQGNTINSYGGTGFSLGVSADSPILGLKFFYADDPTDIDFSATNVNEKQNGLLLGELIVNDNTDAVGPTSNALPFTPAGTYNYNTAHLYTYTITGEDADLVEISSLGYLRIKSDAQVYRHQDQTLDFTITATSPTGVTYSEDYSLPVNAYQHTITYADGTKVFVGLTITMTESDGTVTVLTTDANGQVTLPTTSNTFTLAASQTEKGDDPISLVDAIHIVQYAGELRTLDAGQLLAADVNKDGEIDVLDAIWIVQHLGELRTLDSDFIFLDTATGLPLSETTFSPTDIPGITVVRLGDVDQDFDPTTITAASLTATNSIIDSEADADTIVDDLEIIDGTNLSDPDLLASVVLPDSVAFDASNETIDLNGFLGFESDSLGLNFDAFSEDSVVADIQPVKIVPTVTYHAAMEYHENSSIEDLVYSSELG